jgi:hypothetical protein
MSEAPSRFRSPPYPYIGLGRAIERAELLYAKARHFPVALPTAAEAWGTKITSSATLQTAAALLQYGLVDDQGARDTRRFKLSELGLKIVMDKRPSSSERAAAMKEAALNPNIFNDLWSQFGSALGLDDSILIHALTLERAQNKKAPYSQEAAREVVRVYRETIAHSGLSDGREGSITPPEEPDAGDEQIDIGDLVQWAPGGNLALPEPARVRLISADRKWVFVEGSDTGLPYNEVEVFERAPTAPALGLRTPAPSVAAPAVTPPTLPAESALTAQASTLVPDSIKLTLDGGRVLVAASVDLAGLRRLQRRLSAIEAMLEEDEAGK